MISKSYTLLVIILLYAYTLFMQRTIKIMRQKLSVVGFALEEAKHNERKEGARVSGYNIVKLSKMFHDAKTSNCHILVDYSANNELTHLETAIKLKFTIAVLRKFSCRYLNKTEKEAAKIPKKSTKSDRLGNKTRGMALIVAEYLLEHHNDTDSIEYLRSLIDAPI